LIYDDKFTEIEWHCSSADHSTANASASKEPVSHLASAGSLAPSGDIYTKFKLSFAVDTIQMELFTGDRDVVNAIVLIMAVFFSRSSGRNENIHCGP